LESPLPHWFAEGELEETEPILSAIAAMVLGVAAATVGGWLGSRYHRRADRTIAHEGSQVRARTSSADIARSHEAGRTETGRTETGRTETVTGGSAPGR